MHRPPLTAEAPDLERIPAGGFMNNDELKGKTDQVKGRAKQAWGDVTNDQNLHDEGVADEAAGTVEEGFGKGRRKVGEALKDLGNEIKK
jgi:uncharacterized protein YjbJ (UPF0337 family)